MNKHEQATGGVQKYTDGKIWQIVGPLIRPAMLWWSNHYQHEFTFDRKTFFLFLTIIINQKVQTTKEMRNQANYKFTVCWVCLAVIKSVCKIVWRAASVLFVFQWYYNRRGGGHQHREGSPHFHSTPASEYCSVELWVWILSTRNTLPLWLEMCMMCFAIATPQQFVHLPIWVMHWAYSVHFLSLEFWALFLFLSQLQICE